MILPVVKYPDFVKSIGELQV